MKRLTKPHKKKSVPLGTLFFSHRPGITAPERTATDSEENSFGLL